MKGSLYIKGLLLFLFGGAGLAEHITSGRGSFPISAVVFGLGFILIVMSYVKER
jgi:formate/nitrite transporter FocA (FNT family)